MSRNSHFEVSSFAARPAEREAPDARAEEAIESLEGREISFDPSPVRGILNAVAIGAGAWLIILGAAVLARAIFFS